MNNDNLQNMRTDYRGEELTIDKLHQNPIEQFKLWFNQAIELHVPEPNAFCLSTIEENKPNSRIVLVKEIRENGIVFYTNYNSQKGNGIAENPHVSVNFFWQPIARQVRINGICRKLSPTASDAYFNKRPLDSRIGAITSPQSQPIENREWLTNQWKANEEKFGKEPQRPNYWGGYLIQPITVEFWQGQPNRLHDRFFYEQIDEKWTISRLAP